MCSLSFRNSNENNIPEPDQPKEVIMIKTTSFQTTKHNLKMHSMSDPETKIFEQISMPAKKCNSLPIINPSNANEASKINKDKIEMDLLNPPPMVIHIIPPTPEPEPEVR